MVNAERLAEIGLKATRWACWRVITGGMIGMGDADKADALAVAGINSALEKSGLSFYVAAGEGERDKAPMLRMGTYIGKQTKDAIHMVVDPIDGTSLVAKGLGGAISVLAFAQSMLEVPDIHMQKLAIRPGANLEDVPIDFWKDPHLLKSTMYILAHASQKPIEQLVICALDRPRHADMINAFRAVGVRMHLIQHGDVDACVRVGLCHIDMYIGAGGSPEGMLGAAILRCLGGTFKGQLCVDYLKDDALRESALDRIRTAGLDCETVYSCSEFIKGDTVFVASGLTSGTILKGIDVMPNGAATTHSVVMSLRDDKLRQLQWVTHASWN